MKYQLFIIGIATLFAACGSSQKTSTETPEIKVPPAPVTAIVVDGKMQDWQGVALETNGDGSISYAFANNNDNLYLLFKITDPVEQMKLVRGGMEIWFDPTGRHAKTTEVIYPVKGELPEETFRANFIPGEKPNTSDLHRRIESGLVSFNRIGFKPEYSGVQSIRENTGFKGAINWDETEALVYEVAIPFAAFPTDVRKANMEVGFFIGTVDKPKASTGEGTAVSEGGRGTSTGGMHGGGGGRRGGGGGYSGNRQHSENNQQHSSANNSGTWKKMYEPEFFWVQYGTK